MSYCDDFNARLRDELCSRELFYTPQEVEIVIEERRRHWNKVASAFILGLPSARLAGRAMTGLETRANFAGRLNSSAAAPHQ
jgi:hypothetical protein